MIEPFLQGPRLSFEPLYVRRFIAKLDVRADGCWNWVGAHSSGGYAQLGTNAGAFPAHRLAYEWFVGPIPDGLELDHLCRNRGCVNPAHLDPVTHQENCRRGCLGTRKLTDEEVREIRRRHQPGRKPRSKTGGSSQELAREFGVTPGYISMLSSRKARF